MRCARVALLADAWHRGTFAEIGIADNAGSAMGHNNAVKGFLREANELRMGHSERSAREARA